MSEPSRQAQWVLVLATGLFLGLVLYVYQAFGIYQGVSFSGHTLLFRVGAFACVSSCLFAVNEFFVRRFLLVDTAPKLVFWHLWEILSAGSATHFLFNYFWNFTESSWGSYLLLQGEFASVMVIPLSLHFLVNSRTSEKITMLHFTSENGKEQVSVQLDKFLYIKAEDNYIRIVFQSGGEEKSKMLRGKLSNQEKKYPQMLRVHRSFIVNPSAIQHIERKPKQTTVHFEYSSVPVSSFYMEALEQRLIRHSGTKFTTYS